MDKDILHNIRENCDKSSKYILTKKRVINDIDMEIEKLRENISKSNNKNDVDELEKLEKQIENLEYDLQGILYEQILMHNLILDLRLLNDSNVGYFKDILFDYEKNDNDISKVKKYLEDREKIILENKEENELKKKTRLDIIHYEKLKEKLEERNKKLKDNFENEFEIYFTTQKMIEKKEREIEEEKVKIKELLGKKNKDNIEKNVELENEIRLNKNILDTKIREAVLFRNTNSWILTIKKLKNNNIDSIDVQMEYWKDLLNELKSNIKQVCENVGYDFNDSKSEDGNPILNISQELKSISQYIEDEYEIAERNRSFGFDNNRFINNLTLGSLAIGGYFLLKNKI
jgi:hypothetical protein